MFTREQIEEIKGLDGGRMEYHFACVTQSKFKRGTPSAVDSRLYTIYEEATGKHLALNGCKTCQFNNYTEVARLYNESKEFYEKLDEEKAGEEIVDLVTGLHNLEQETLKKPTKNKSPKTTRKTTKKK